MMTPLRHSGRVLWPRVLQGMAAMALACALLVPAAIAAEPSGPGAAQPAGAPGATIREVTVSKSPYNTTIQASVDGTGPAARFYDPENLAVDGSGNIWVADGKGNTIREVTPAGVVTTFAGEAGVAGFSNGTGANAQFNNLLGVAVDAFGNLYVGDGGNNEVRRITSPTL